jgi:chitodextrinase
MRAWLAVGTALGTLFLGAATAQTSVDGAGVFVGFSDDLPKWTGAEAVEPARGLGARGFRITLQWAPGETRLTDADAAELQRAAGAATGMKLVLSVYANTASSAPQTESARDEYCAYVRDALARFPSVRDVVIWNEPNKSLFWRPQQAETGVASAPVAYEALLARCYDVLHTAFADVNVIGFALSPTGNDDAGSHSPGAFIRALGSAYRASGRTRPLLDTVGHHAYGAREAERPWRKHIASKVLSQGDWNKLMYNVWQAFDGTAQAMPGTRGVAIWYMEGGSQTAIDAGKQAAYWGTENVAVIPDDVGGEPDRPPPAETSDAPDQSTQFRDSIRLAACQPYVGAYFNFLLVDEARLAGWQSGAFWADRTPKDSVSAFRQVISEANAGTIDCDALKGGRPSPDFMPPSVPTNLIGTVSTGPLRVELTWSASSDDDGSSIGYRVYRNGTQIGSTSATAWTNTGVAPATTYTYTVRAIDSAGNLGAASAPVTVTTPAVDTTPPETTITAGPEGTVTAAEASFEFVSSESGSRFECALDGASFAVCSSPAAYVLLAAGEHSFLVRATDEAGNADPTPAARTWTVASQIPPPLPPAQPTPPPPPQPAPLPPANPVPAPRAKAAPGVIRTGTARRDVLRGTPGPDALRGLGGADALFGFAGNDVLVGGGARDTVFAGPGNDVVHAKDGARDVIVCGAGADVVYADRVDRITGDCERIRRPAQRR